MSSLEKSYNSQSVEQCQYSAWEASGIHRAEKRHSEAPFVIMMPPPNVTGSLHLGHALNSTLQDILIRFHRMQGRDVLWLPGTDHASIAVHMVIERQLAEEGKHRNDLGREKFIERAWQWKEYSGSTITGQFRRLGVLPDWSRERFTMDEGLSRAVNKAFVQLYKEGLIYRAKRLVNWDPKFQTAISDIEVIQKEVKGKLYHINYPLADESGRSITVATTRPETMLGDAAIAVHPDDERYTDFIGKKVIVPLIGRTIPIIADDYVKSDFGTGALKITPAHDYNDFDIGVRHKLEPINVLDRAASIATDDFIPVEFRGLDRFKARALIAERLEEAGVIEKIEDYSHTVPHGDRGGVPIEPFLTDQWYVDAATLAKPAMEAVRSRETEIIPKSGEAEYYRWLENIRPWCISRQLWWGHQIPAWYDDEGNIYVAENEEDAQKQAPGKNLRRDNDILDTWFSAGLWPFSTLGWPDQTPDLKNFYPGSVLITGLDILFFWVIRMMMMGLHFMHEVPFRTVYLHAMVRDQSGAKMSKSRGNVIDPLNLIDQYGADALRFTLTSLAGQGRDIKLSENRVESSRNFVTKIWNAARFCEHYNCASAAPIKPQDVKLPINQWIFGELKNAVAAVTTSLHELRFNDAANALHEFVWYSFCDWYVEFAKPFLQAENETENRDETKATAHFVLLQILHLLHPFMPYVTEELWQAYAGQMSLLLSQEWPNFEKLKDNREANKNINDIIGIIGAVRSARALLNVPASLLLPLLVHNVSGAQKTLLNDNEILIRRLSRIEAIQFLETAPSAGAAQISVQGTLCSLPLEGVIDFAVEHQRLSKQSQKIDQDIGKIEAKLGNEEFVRNAPEEIIEEQKERLSELQNNQLQLGKALEILKS